MVKQMASDAVLFYADHPVEFVVDIIGAKPDEEQATSCEVWLRIP